MTISELIDRLEKAEAPCREIDGAIHAATNPPLRDGLRFGHIPAYTASVDAAIGLVERVLPGWCFDEVGQDYEGHPSGLLAFGWTAELTNGHKRTQGQAPALPLAICIAILRALQAKEAQP